MTSVRTTVIAGADEAGLAVASRLLATSTRQHSGQPDADRLADLAEAQHWLDTVVAPGLELTARDLPPLRRFRESLRDALTAGRDNVLSAGRDDTLSARRDGALGARQEGVLGAGRDGVLGAGRETAVAADQFESTVELTWGPDGVRFAPRGQGWRRIVAAVSMELLVAEAAGVRSRFKTCAYEPCGYPFFDGSRNQSRAWHDTARCGNIVNLRASRARKTTS